MRKLILFIRLNARVLIGLTIGLVLGYLHWYYFGYSWGTYPLSAECWVNCVAGATFGGFVMSLSDKKNFI
ncbi:MAG: hypothetical protein E6767_12015 [Dysgonomonas sp.]|nr:hypothetical protein [Dysgonomonas sp.]